ncbi:MAG: MobA/MobL family protein [Carnobacterium sp.]|nr:MobA/MobL family protein [Carnobacterium sp.]
MAIYHLSAKTISRGKGQSATASSAYRSGEKLYSERYGESNLYVREVKPETFILKPNHAPEWTLNREKLWNEVEKIEKQKNAVLSREMNIALPNELSKEEQLELTKEYVQRNFVDRGMVADVAIHRDDLNNPHFHVMLTVRPFNQDGSWGNKQKKIYIYDEKGNKLRTPAGNIKSKTENFVDWKDKETLYSWRRNWATLTNKYLENAGSTQRISEKSFVELGEEKTPTIHEGYVAREMEKNGKISERVERNREIRKENYDKQKDNSTETIRVIMQPLSPKEKGELKLIAKNLKVFVNYDNLVDKERMIKNWQRTEAINKIIKPDEFDSSILDKIELTKENIARGKEILENQYLRIFEKHYPELVENNFSNYAKINIAKRSLEIDKVLELEEVVSILSESRDNEVRDILKTISNNSYVKPSIEYNRAIVVATKKLDDFYKENNVNEETVKNLPDDKKEEFKKLYSYQDLQLNTKELISNYYNQTILSAYPTANLSELKFGEREELSKAISYYGNTLSYTKLVEASQEKFISKYNTYEQRIGMKFIDKIENETFTKEEMQDIENDYRKKELFDTVSKAGTKELFLNEVANNNEFTSEDTFNSEGAIQPSQSLLQKLAKNSNLYDNLLNASQDNAKRTVNREDKHKVKKAKSVIDKKQQTNGNRSM